MLKYKVYEIDDATGEEKLIGENTNDFVYAVGVGLVDDRAKGQITCGGVLCLSGALEIFKNLRKIMGPDWCAFASSFAEEVTDGT